MDTEGAVCTNADCHYDLSSDLPSSVLEGLAFQKLPDQVRLTLVLSISWMVQMSKWLSADAARASRLKALERVWI